jgi:hypothetical protein
MAVQSIVSTSSILDLSSAQPARTGSATIGIDGGNLSPVGFISPGVAKWVDRIGGQAVGYPSLTLSVREPTKSSRVYKVTVKLDIPTMETISNSTVSGILPAPQKAYSCQVVMEFLLPERSTLLERQTLLRRTVSLFHRVINASDDVPTNNTNTPLIDAVELFEPVW